MTKFVAVLIYAYILFPTDSFPQFDTVENLYTQENILKFAEYLFNNGDNERAIGEYMRIVALCRDNKLKDSLLYKAAVASLRDQNPEAARKYCKRISVDTTNTLLGGKAACLMAFTYYVDKKFDTSAEIASLVQLRLPGQEWHLRSSQIRTASLLNRFQWREAMVEAQKQLRCFNRNGDDSLLRKLYNFGLEGTRLNLKSPAIAGIMSAVLPGSGKMYAGRTWDGLVSFLFVSVLGLEAYIGYKNDGLVSVRCLSFGLFGSAFYCGNIYGSLNAAHLHNKSQNQNICDRIKLQFEW